MEKRIGKTPYGSTEVELIRDADNLSPGFAERICEKGLIGFDEGDEVVSFSLHHSKGKEDWIEESRYKKNGQPYPGGDKTVFVAKYSKTGVKQDSRPPEIKRIE